MSKGMITILMLVVVCLGFGFFAGCKEELSAGTMKSSLRPSLTRNKSKSAINPVVRIELSISKRQTSQSGRVSQVIKGHCTGSGFIVSSDGYIITNNHVIHPEDGHEDFNVDSLRVRFNPNKPFIPNKRSGATCKAKVVAFDKDADIAVIKIEYPEPLPVLPLGSPVSTQVGDSVNIRGYPLGGRFKQTKGKMIQRLQPSTERPTGILVCNAKAVPGNSGGPALDVKGNVVGVTVAMVDVKWARLTGETADYATQALDRMRAMTIKKAKETGMSDSLRQGLLKELGKGVQEIDELRKQLSQSWVWREAQKHPHLTYTIASDDVKRLLNKWNIKIKGTTKSLLAENPSLINQRDPGNGDTPLHKTARNNFSGNTAGVATTIALIDRGADVNAKNNEGHTPLHKACSPLFGNNSFTVMSTEIAKILIEHGADLNARDKYDSTPLHYAAMMPFDTSFAELLINNGANINARNKKGKTPLGHATLINNTVVVKFLRKYGAVK